MSFLRRKKKGGANLARVQSGAFSAPVGRKKQNYTIAEEPRVNRGRKPGKKSTSSLDGGQVRDLQVCVCVCVCP